MLNLKNFFVNEEKNLYLLNSRGKDFTTSIQQLKKLSYFHKQFLFFLESEQRKVNLIQHSLASPVAKTSELYQKLLTYKKIIQILQEYLFFLSVDFKTLLSALPNLPNSQTILLTKNKHKYVAKNVVYKSSLPVNNLFHGEIAKKLNWIDTVQTVKMSKSRFLTYKGEGALLLRILKNFMLNQHLYRGYQELAVPHLVKEKTLWATGQFPKMTSDCFKITNHDLFLLPTSEVALVNFASNKLFNLQDLPAKFCAYSLCFRQEAGASGKDTKGLIRLHQFHKVEIVQICRADRSEKVLDVMIKDAAAILDLLKISYRIVLLPNNDIAHAASQTYDLEVWLPSQKKYLEIASISNTTDFQSQFLKIKYQDSNKQKHLAHTLNGSGLAIDRLIAVLLENYYDQKNNLFIWPDILKPYLFPEANKKIYE